MEAQVGSNGPGAMDRSNFSSGNEPESPNGTLSSARGEGMMGSGVGPGPVAQPAITASNVMTAFSWIPKLTTFMARLSKFRVRKPTRFFRAGDWKWTRQLFAIESLVEGRTWYSSC